MAFVCATHVVTWIHTFGCTESIIFRCSAGSVIQEKCFSGGESEGLSDMDLFRFGNYADGIGEE